MKRYDGASAIDMSQETWLPFCLIGTKPTLARALMISLPDRTGSRSDNDGYQLAAFLLGFGVVLFEDKFKGFSQVRDGLFLGLALADGLRQLDASSCIVTRFFILPKANGEGALNHFQSASCRWQASIFTCRLPEVGELESFWKDRVGKYRIVYKMDETKKKRSSSMMSILEGVSVASRHIDRAN
jgi:hypothetical protein